MVLILPVQRANGIVTQDISAPQPLDFDLDDIYHNWKAKEENIATIITQFYSPDVWRIAIDISSLYMV